ncbi:MAG: hypothetical protein ABI648_05975 [Betaproteobacteria bacterium]|jgi:aspartokinase-like uncharacterized kinase
MKVCVVKLGGSLARSDELPKWLDVVATAGAGQVVLVPGGGPWADEVRVAQAREGFDDGVAHRKALRAMEQYGNVLCRMRANFMAAHDVAAIDEALRNAQVAVWMPYEMVFDDVSIPQTWDVTSDSLAAWLARKIGAARLVLVKSVPVSDPGMRAVDMANNGWVDACFDRFCADAKFQYCLLGHGDHRQLAQVLAGRAGDPPPDPSPGSRGERAPDRQ